MGEDRLFSCAKGATGWTSGRPGDFNINYGLLVGVAWPVGSNHPLSHKMKCIPLGRGCIFFPLMQVASWPLCFKKKKKNKMKYKMSKRQGSHRPQFKFIHVWRHQGTLPRAWLHYGSGLSFYMFQRFRASVHCASVLGTRRGARSALSVTVHGN
jgi:hypothetical protein